MPKKSININDTSLFAELVKGNKHKRAKVLKEILSETTTAEATVAATKTETPQPPPSTNGDLKDIPVPPANGIPCVTIMSTTESHHEVENAPPQQPPLPPLPPVEAPPVIKKVMELPMPPGVVVPMELKTPSPPKEPPIAGPSKKIKLTELPMPPTVPGTEDLSDDENDVMIAKRVQKAIARGNGTTLNVSRGQRPRIINRRLSGGPDGNWGERCVDVFEIMAQIGEGL